MFSSLRSLLQHPKVVEPRKRKLLCAMHLAGRLIHLPLEPFERKRPVEPSVLQRILLIRADAIGDFIMSTAIFPALRRSHPLARIDLLCKPASKPLAELFSDDINSIYLWNDEDSLQEFRRLACLLRENHYDAIADLRGDFRYVLLSRFIGAPHRLGYAYSGFDYLLTQALEVKGLHPVEEVARIGEALGTFLSDPSPRLPLREEDVRFADRWLKEQGVSCDVNLISMHITATRPAKLWPIERFRTLAARLQKEVGARLLLVGGPEDREEAEEFSASLPHPAVALAGSASLPQTAAILQRSRLFIGNDSGPAHMASAVGCPVVALFGATDSRYYRPWGDRCRILDAGQTCDRRCDQKVCAIPDRHCMNALSTEAVYAAVMEQLSRYPTPASPKADEDPLPCA